MGHHLVQWLQAGEVDAALLYVPTMTGLVDYDVLLHEPLYVVFPPGQSVDNRPLAVEALLDLPLVLPSTPHGLRALAASWAERYGKPLKLAAEADNSTIISRRLVQAGLGCTVLPLGAVQEEVARGLLQARRLEGPGALREVAIATARNRPPVSGSWELTREVRHVVAQLVTQGQWPGVSGMAN